jgi:L-rhamnose mutarotase
VLAGRVVAEERGGVSRPIPSEQETAMHRVCFTLQVRPDRMEEYAARHAAVWPEMLHALRDTGWHDYSLFLRDDGLLVGYLMTHDLLAAQEGMARTDVNARWQAEMAEFFVDLDLPPDQGFWQLSEVFHLEDQLAALTSTTIDSPTQTAQDQ